MKQMSCLDFFEEVKVTRPHHGYYFHVGEAILLILLGCLCGLRSVMAIHTWATTEHVENYLREEFEIQKIPCYYWLLCLLKLIDPESLSQAFSSWVATLVPEGKTVTIAVDGKTIRSTGHMKKYLSPLHIVSAYISELGLTFGQATVSGKSNEIPAVQELLEKLRIKGCVIVADAMNCQKKTADIVKKKQADYVFCVKDNHYALKKDLEEYVQDSELRKEMQTFHTQEKNRGRLERRTAYVTQTIRWIPWRKDWKGLKSIGAIYSEIERKEGISKEWRYYISSLELSPEELLSHVRKEWAVESMHWLLDVHFHEDFCRMEDVQIQKSLNILRKTALNLIKMHKTSLGLKKPLSHIMMNFLLCPQKLNLILNKN